MERSYVIPLRREWLKVPAYKRSKKAVTGLREFLSKHMKSEDIHIAKDVNLKIWEKGIKKPPHKIQVKVKKEDDGKVLCQLPDKPFPDLSIAPEQEESMMSKTIEKFTGKKKVPKNAQEKAVEKTKEPVEKKAESVVEKTAEKPVEKTETKVEEKKEELKENQSEKKDESNLESNSKNENQTDKVEEKKEELKENQSEKKDESAEKKEEK